MVLWASSFIALKLAFRSYDPMVVIFSRMVVAGICFLVLSRKFAGVAYHRGDWKPILFMAFCEPCLYFLFEAQALKLTTASQAGMIASLLPLLVAFFARIFLKEIVTLRTLTGLFIAVAGAVWLSLAGNPATGAPNPPLGNFLEFMAMVCATGYVITLKRLTSRYSPFLLTAFQAFVGSIFYFPFLLLPTTVLPTEFHWTGAAAIVYLGAFISLGAYGLYNFGVSRIPASQASAFVNLIPVFTILLGWLILDERFTPLQWPAVGVIFGGLFFSQDKPGQTARRSGELKYGARYRAGRPTPKTEQITLPGGFTPPPAGGIEPYAGG